MNDLVVLEKTVNSLDGEPLYRLTHAPVRIEGGVFHVEAEQCFNQPADVFRDKVSALECETIADVCDQEKALAGIDAPDEDLGPIDAEFDPAFEVVEDPKYMPMAHGSIKQNGRRMETAEVADLLNEQDAKLDAQNIEQELEELRDKIGDLETEKRQLAESKVNLRSCYRDLESLNLKMAADVVTLKRTNTQQVEGIESRDKTIKTLREDVTAAMDNEALLAKAAADSEYEARRLGDLLSEAHGSIAGLEKQIAKRLQEDEILLPNWISHVEVFDEPRQMMVARNEIAIDYNGHIGSGRIVPAVVALVRFAIADIEGVVPC